MKEKRFKLLSYIYAFVFLCSLGLPFFSDSSGVVYFFGIFPSIVTLLVFFIYIILINSDKFHKIDISTTILAGCYFVSLHTIYTTYIDDVYFYVFLIVKEILIVFVIFATRLLVHKLSKNDKRINLLKMVKFTLFVLTIFSFLSIVIDQVVELNLGIYLYMLSFFFIVFNPLILEADPK